MGKRTSIYLSGDREAAVEATGKTLVELIDVALETLAGQGGNVGEPAPASANAPRRSYSKPAAGDCKHPKARRAKGLCMACGTFVGTS